MKKPRFWIDFPEYGTNIVMYYMPFYSGYSAI